MEMTARMTFVLSTFTAKDVGEAPSHGELQRSLLAVSPTFLGRAPNNSSICSYLEFNPTPFFDANEFFLYQYFGLTVTLMRVSSFNDCSRRSFYLECYSIAAEAVTVQMYSQQYLFGASCEKLAHCPPHRRSAKRSCNSEWAI